MSSQIQGLEPISLIAKTTDSSVNFPRFVPVPESPFAICDSELFLETLSQTPFSRFIVDLKSVMEIAEGGSTDGKDGRTI